MTTIITAGCSFSHWHYDHRHTDKIKYPDHDLVGDFSNRVHTWPNHIEHEFDNAIHLGLSSVGNGIISRRVITTVSDFIEKNDKDDLVVGIMWSSFARGDIYNPKFVSNDSHIHNNIKDNIVCNPIWADYKHINKHQFTITSSWWTSETDINYYTALNSEHLVLLSIDNVLRTQWFLKLNNIKYFMCQYTNDWIPQYYVSDPSNNLYDPVLNSGWNMIDFSNWLPITGCYDWCLENTNIPFYKKDIHPNTEQHKLFTEKVILPFLTKKEYI